MEHFIRDFYHPRVYRIQVCLLVICACYGIPVIRNDIMNYPSNGTEDSTTEILSTLSYTSESLTKIHILDDTTKMSTTSLDLQDSNNIITDSQLGSRGQRPKEGRGEQISSNNIKHNLSESEPTRELSTFASVDVDVQTMNITTRKGQHRTRGLCLGLNHEDLCRQAVLAVSKLDELYLAVKRLFTRKQFSIIEPTQPLQIDGNCTVNVSQLTSDLRTVVTAVCLVENVTDVNQSVGGCCLENSLVKEEFQRFIAFLQINVFRKRVAVDQICLGRNVNAMWLVNHVMSTLQNTKKVLLGIESGRCQI
ncbi:uncharacterized protein LOC117329571 [Pecten maximus]|uniref:uncharacterized protein LOC117329571 n=1 Tax=Pecten maximus TaxID=6579 RepID=UPI001457FB8E|nr:uncharacterized protein LOC117329571 [Pecten maximus]